MGDTDHGSLDLTPDKMHDPDHIVTTFVDRTWPEEGSGRFVKGRSRERERARTRERERGRGV